MNKLNLCGSFLSIMMLVGCSTSYSPEDLQLTKAPPSQLRVMQSKQFSQTDQAVLLQSVMKTLAGLDFQVVRVDTQLGLIEAMQLQNDHIMQVNVIIEHLPTNGSIIRMNVRYNQYPVEDPNVYQRFFETLSKNLS